MVYELLKRVISQKNSFMTTDMIMLQIEFFYTAGKLTEEQYNELINDITSNKENESEGDVIEDNN